jgi:hypothetical protein
LFAVGQSGGHLSCQYVPKVCESLAPALELLVESLYQLDEFTGIDVGIPRTFDVFDDLWRETGWKDAGGLAQREQVLDEAFAGAAGQRGARVRQGVRVLNYISKVMASVVCEPRNSCAWQMSMYRLSMTALSCSMRQSVMIGQRSHADNIPSTWSRPSVEAMAMTVRKMIKDEEVTIRALSNKIKIRGPTHLPATSPTQITEHLPLWTSTLSVTLPLPLIINMCKHISVSAPIH